MNTCTIHGNNIQLALREVRNRLGPDAVIVSTRETDSGVEIVAASTNGNRPAPAALARARQTSVADELQALGLTPDVRADVLKRLRREAREESLEAALEAVGSKLPIEAESLLERGGRVAIVGGTGVGKTTTVVKLAAHFARMHGPCSVALVNADNFRIGASEQLRRYARLMGLKTCDVKDPGELRDAFRKFARCQLVLLDTAGAAHDRTVLVDQLERLRHDGLDVSSYLALSLNTQTAAMERTAREFAGFGLTGCILTKSDEAASLGAGLSIAMRHDLPIGFVTTGPGVPADIMTARSDWLIDRALGLFRESRREQARLQEAN